MQFFFATMKHKWFVMLAGIRLGVPFWRLVIHDWSKFTPVEYRAYQRQFYGRPKTVTSAQQALAFEAAFLHHQNSNPHHWEYWINRSKRADYDPRPLPMPEHFIREMIADWFAACRAYEGFWPTPERWPWLSEHWSKINLHKDTRERVVRILNEHGFDNFA